MIIENSKVVVFLSNVPYVKNSQGSGNWVNNLLDKLLAKPSGFSFYLISLGNNREIETIKFRNGLTQYLLPRFGLVPYGDTPKQLNVKFTELCNTIGADIIHVWGTEGVWMDLIGQKDNRTYKVILSIQGLVNSLKDKWYSGLNIGEIIKISWSLIELYRWKYSYLSKYLKFEAHSKREIDALNKSNLVLVQSNWVMSWVKGLIPLKDSPKIKFSDKILREEFYESSKWQYSKSEVFQIITISNGRPYKGLHDLIKALSIISDKYSMKFELTVIGYNPFENKNYLRTGYDRYILSLVERLNLNNKIKFKSSKNASELVSEFLSSSIFVQTSYVESYSFVLAEALYLGVPSVVSFAGALSEYDFDTCFFYPSGDIMALANAIYEGVSNEDRIRESSRRAIDFMERKVGSSRIVENHLKMYQEILNT